MNEIILMKLGEMVLKGLNRRSFEDKLLANAKRRLAPYGSFRVQSAIRLWCPVSKTSGTDSPR